MQKSNRSKTSKPSQPRGMSQKKTQNSSKSTKTQTRTRGAAQFKDSAPYIGLRDLSAHKVSWLAGYVSVGDGTNGAADSVYFRCIGASSWVPGTSGGGQVPVLGSDTLIGQTYVSDVEKHYARKVLRSAKVHFISATPSTANSMTLIAAPVRGASASGDTVVFSGATTAAPTAANTLGMAGAKSCASYESTCLDLTAFIAGGSGAKQNEFSINRDGETSATQWGAGNLDLTGIAPCAFVVSGTNSTAALRGVSTHYVVIETICDYLDFLAGNANPNPLSFTATFSREEAMMVLKAILSHPAKEARELAFVRDLTRRISQTPL